MDEFHFVFCLKLQGMESGAVVVCNNQPVPGEFQVFFSPLSFKPFELLEKSHIIRFLLEFRILFIDDLEAAETLFKCIGAELFHCGVYPFVFTAGPALYKSGQADKYKSKEKSR